MRRRVRPRRWVILLAASLAVPTPVLAGGTPLGTARALRAGEASLDRGATWVRLSALPFPVQDGTALRSGGGVVALEMTDGSRVTLLPFSTASMRATAAGTEVRLARGRLTFELPAKTRVAIETPTARLEPVRLEAMSGEVFAAETTGLKMTRGRLAATAPGGSRAVVAAPAEPVFLPARPATPGPLFADELRGPAPAGARGVFTTGGQSAGYVRPDGRLVVHPGFTSDLTGPFARRTREGAVASIPLADRGDAEPLFDVHGAYVGYLSGAMFHAPARLAAQAQGGPVFVETLPGDLKGGWPWYYYVGGVAVVAAGALGIAAAGGGGGDGGSAPPASPLGP